MENKPIKFCAVVGYYQDRDAGLRLAVNLQMNKIHSIWCNGRVEGFPQINNSDLSTDGLTEILEQMPDVEVVNVGLQNPQAETNKVRMFEEAAKRGYDTVIVLGCDEFLEGDIEEFLNDAKERSHGDTPKKWFVELVNYSKQKNYNYYGKAIGRVYYLPGKIFRKFCHWGYFFNDSKGEEKPLITFLPKMRGIKVIHDDSIRPEWRNKIMDDYQETVVPQETQKLETYLNKFRNKK